MNTRPQPVKNGVLGAAAFVFHTLPSCAPRARSPDHVAKDLLFLAALLNGLTVCVGHMKTVPALKCPANGTRVPLYLL